MNRASTDDDITLCENALYAQTPQPQLVPCAYVPLQEDANAHGMCTVQRTDSLSRFSYNRGRPSMKLVKQTFPLLPVSSSLFQPSRHPASPVRRSFLYANRLNSLGSWVFVSSRKLREAELRLPNDLISEHFKLLLVCPVKARGLPDWRTGNYIG